MTPRGVGATSCICVRNSPGGQRLLAREFGGWGDAVALSYQRMQVGCGDRMGQGELFAVSESGRPPRAGGGFLARRPQLKSRNFVQLTCTAPACSAGCTP